MRAELPSLADEIITAIREEIPGYARSMDGPYGDALRAGVTQSLKTFVDQVADPSAPSDERDATCRLLGQFEAREGRPLEELHAAYRVGCQVAWRRLTKVLLHARVSASVTANLADALFGYADELARLSADGYRETQASSVTAQQQCRTRLAREILARPAPPRDVLRQLADQARWAMPETVTPVALRPPLGTAADSVQADITQVGAGVLADLDGPDSCLIIPGPFARTLRSMLATVLPGYQFTAGLTVPLDRAADSLRWARQLRLLADRDIVAPESEISCEDHLIELWLLSDAALADEILRRQEDILEQIPDNEREWLIDTFEPWLERRATANDIAQNLGVHPQTIRYRINRLKEIFGDVIDDPDSRLAFELTLRVMRLRRERSLRSAPARNAEPRVP